MHLKNGGRLLDKKHLEQNTEPANSSCVQYSEL